MRFDFVTIFPEYFQVLDISLLGKAQKHGDLDINVHNLRDWATGKHLAVDDSPAGGGAGMVMRPDVWGRALDQVLAEPLTVETPRRVLAIPSPAGTQLTQRTLEELTAADQIVVACGRYEGPDARLAAHYRNAGVEVLEYSLGDYVLNGGEVAALALVEGVGRLLGGVVGNPHSLVEESHGQSGLLEYPVYTHPRSWRGLDTPSVLASGDHAKIAKWRRHQSLMRTARMRPDLLANLDADELSGDDRVVLARSGYLVVPEFTSVELRPACEEDLPQLSVLASTTFPDACPPQVTAKDIAVHVAREFSVDNLRRYMLDDDALLWVAQSDGELAGYALALRKLPPDLAAAPPEAAYISKCYTSALFRGSGISGALLEEILAAVQKEWGAPAAALATHIGNKRASRFYRKMGFRKRGRRHFLVGDTDNIDDVFVLELTGAEQGK